MRCKPNKIIITVKTSTTFDAQNTAYFCVMKALRSHKVLKATLKTETVQLNKEVQYTLGLLGRGEVNT